MKFLDAKRQRNEQQKLSMEAMQKISKVKEMLRIYREVEVPGLQKLAQGDGPLKAYYDGRAEGMERVIEVLERTINEE